MKKRLLIIVLVLALLGQTASGAEYIKWVDFNVGYEAMARALAIDIDSQGREKPLSWIDILALAATWKGGGNFGRATVDKAAEKLAGDERPEDFLGESLRYYNYFREAYGAALGGLVGNYAIEKTAADGSKYWDAAYGVKAFSPIAAGYWYNHYDDFGAGRNYGFARKHLGNDLMGSLGTPVVAVENGTVEALGWNQYGGWRVGVRSLDRKRYYYYAHLRKDSPYAPNLKEGDRVAAGDLLGFMGRSGYSTKENVNNIEVVHLHFGMELIFDESQKECLSEIWIDVYDIVRLLDRHRSSWEYDSEKKCWNRLYPFRDLDCG